MFLPFIAAILAVFGLIQLGDTCRLGHRLQITAGRRCCCISRASPCSATA